MLLIIEYCDFDNIYQNFLFFKMGGGIKVQTKSLLCELMRFYKFNFKHGFFFI